ncbi:hypothetical protein [Priestia megaterium]|uniref:hypothetical protein n=1 Tax=Priestia megaterium TaxID=1404 RepID=UPI00203FC291|nr:hypothetical protein [Priestia megaterium]MCM3197161.1 hypothetical protein [Priestia megaterium]
MPVAFTGFTNPANTTRIADSATAPGAPVIVPGTPAIDGNTSYLWSPVTASGQVVTFRSVFSFGAPLIALALPISATYAFAGNETVVVSGTLEVLNVLGVPILTVPGFLTGSNGGNPNNVELVFDDAIVAAGLLTLGGTIRITIDATVTAPITGPYDPPNTGRYLGELTVQTII